MSNERLKGASIDLGSGRMAGKSGVGNNRSFVFLLFMGNAKASR